MEPIFPPALKQLVQQALAPAAAAQCSQGICRQRHDLDGGTVTEPQEPASHLYMIAPANLGWHDGLLSLGDFGLHLEHLDFRDFLE